MRFPKNIRRRGRVLAEIYGKSAAQAAQAARLRRQTKGRKDEVVCLVTNLEPAQLTPRPWLDCNRLAWGIENGLHQRLDISRRDE